GVCQTTGSLKQRLRDAKAVVLRSLAPVGDGIDFFARGVFHVWRNRAYLTPIKLANSGLVELQFRLKMERVVGRPYSVKIESTNICNTKCQLCPTGLGLSGRPKGKMTYDQYTGLVDNMAWFVRDLDLSMWGDPLIVPDIYKMIRYAHDKGIWTYISSNLHAFKIDPPRPRKGVEEQAEVKDQATHLVESGLDLMTCSLHGATQETYEIYQPGKTLADSIAKIKHILATRDRLGSATPQVQLNFVVTRFNEHEIDDFQKLADELGCKAVFSTASFNARFQDKDKKLVSLGLSSDLKKTKVKEHVEHWMPKKRLDYVLEPYIKMARDGVVPGPEYNGKKEFNCSWPWRQTVINWDGHVVMCCGNFDPKEDIGNVFDDGFATVWNNRKYRMARRSFKKKLSDDDAKDNACASCPGFML
ncbi:MAG: radical SAM protein, partial [Planctomycetota bacterium]